MKPSAAEPICFDVAQVLLPAYAILIGINIPMLGKA